MEYRKIGDNYYIRMDWSNSSIIHPETGTGFWDFKD